MNNKLSHFMSTVKVGPKGQIVIPKEIREMFDIEPGDNLIIMADIQRGIAVHKQSIMEDIAKIIMNGELADSIYKDNYNNSNAFANAINETTKKGESKIENTDNQ